MCRQLQVSYFGDRDDKGEQILDSALKDIRVWCDVDFEIERVGLTLDQARSMGVPENFEKPGDYQWEALTDAQAASLIEPVTALIDHDAWDKVLLREDEAAERAREVFKHLLANKGGNGALPGRPYLGRSANKGTVLRVQEQRDPRSICPLFCPTDGVHLIRPDQA